MVQPTHWRDLQHSYSLAPQMGRNIWTLGRLAKEYIVLHPADRIIAMKAQPGRLHEGIVVPFATAHHRYLYVPGILCR